MPLRRRKLQQQTSSNTSFGPGYPPDGPISRRINILYRQMVPVWPSVHYLLSSLRHLVSAFVTGRGAKRAPQGLAATAHGTAHTSARSVAGACMRAAAYATHGRPLGGGSLLTVVPRLAPWASARRPDSTRASTHSASHRPRRSDTDHSTDPGAIGANQARAGACAMRLSLVAHSSSPATAAALAALDFCFLPAAGLAHRGPPRQHPAHSALCRSGRTLANQRTRAHTPPPVGLLPQQLVHLSTSFS